MAMSVDDGAVGSAPAAPVSRRVVLGALLASRPWGAGAADVEELVLATPGPGSAVSAIPELAVRIEADRQEGLALRLKFTSGGGIAIREIYSGNAQCAVFGLTAAMNENLRGPRLVALAAVEDRAPLALAVRSDLKGTVRSVADLKGRVVGVHSNSLATKTNGQQFLELLLRHHGLKPEDVRIVAAGQSWDSQSASLRSGIADAVVSEEPFGIRLEQAGLAFTLLRAGLADQPLGLPGEGFLRGALIARPEFVASRPDLAARIVRTVQRTLAWRREHSAQQMIDALGLSGPEAAAFGAMLARHPQLFSGDGRFSAAQLAQTEQFFRASAADVPEAAKYAVESMLADRWVGRKP